MWHSKLLSRAGDTLCGSTQAAGFGPMEWGLGHGRPRVWDQCLGHVWVGVSVRIWVAGLDPRFGLQVSGALALWTRVRCNRATAFAERPLTIASCCDATTRARVPRARQAGGFQGAVTTRPPSSSVSDNGSLAVVQQGHGRLPWQGKQRVPTPFSRSGHGLGAWAEPRRACIHDSPCFAKHSQGADSDLLSSATGLMLR